jgi:putative DNA methylase
MTLPELKPVSDTGIPLANATSFIEMQFPVAKISMESYKERKAVVGQTLTGLGKWWGRKPLILVRAVLLGLLMPSSDNLEKDCEIFLKLLTMDTDGLHIRKRKSIPEVRLMEELRKMPPSLQKRFLDTGAKNDVLSKLRKDEKDDLQELVFDRLTYGEKIIYCDRPEQIDGPSVEAWSDINAHLGTKASDLIELVEELGVKRFGHRTRVGDAFCGGGSIPFEAARLGCDVYGSDLNPVASLLTWAGINIIGGGDKIINQAYWIQQEIYRLVKNQIDEWGLEQNSLGWRADAYVYCLEVTDPETGWQIPLLPSLMIAEKPKVIASLIPDEASMRFNIEIIENASEEKLNKAKNSGTIKNSRLESPNGNVSTPIELLRKNLRSWGDKEFIASKDDVFRERLYCIRWLETYTDGDGQEKVRRHYRAPGYEDVKREQKVVELLAERFDDWQNRGFIPRWRIEPGTKTDEPIRTMGWNYWHQLFTPRQLLIHGLISAQIEKLNVKTDAVMALLGLGRCCDWNSRLCRWIAGLSTSGGIGFPAQTFYNQALNTLYNYGSRSSESLLSAFSRALPSEIEITVESQILAQDARDINSACDFWITDPPYADAIAYDEISEFFLAWYDHHLQRLFPNWYSDSKRALAVRGSDESFRRAMVDCYKNLAKNMPENGMQIVMFTHQDASVWADLSMILWAAGLRVTAAWTIATETSSALKAGNYVQGTVLLVLRKRTETEPAFLDEISQRMEAEVRHQLDSMLKLEDNSDPNFGDADYQLAAYAAALRVLTGQPIEEIDPEKEILRERKPGEVGAVEQLIRRAVKIACDYLIPKGLNSDLWKSLGPMERFYIKGLEVESHGEYRSGVYQELARGFGAADYDDLLENTKANETRLKSASEFGKKMLGTSGDSESFADSLVRQCLFAVSLTVKNEDTRDGLNYLHTELKDAYWSNRERIVGILDYLAAMRFAASMEGWQKDSGGANLLAGAVRNDHV